VNVPTAVPWPPLRRPVAGSGKGPPVSTPLVSILIPAYNSERWIAATIESALGQTWKQVEVVVVDDGSSDNTLAVARRYAGEKVRVFAQPENRGAAAARNRALAEARGSVIQYLDADDVLASDKLERQLPLLEDDVLCSGEWGPFYRQPDKARFAPTLLDRDFAPVDFLVTAWGNGLMMQPAAWLLTRTLAMKTGPWDERLSLDDDGEFFTRVLLASKQVRFCAGARVFYRVGNTSSLSWRSSPKAIRSHHLAATLSTERLLAAEDSPRTRRAAAQKLMQFVYMTYPDRKDLVEAVEDRIRTLGMADTVRPSGGKVFGAVSRVIGWKAAKSLRQPYYLAKVRLAKTLEK